MVLDDWLLKELQGPSTDELTGGFMTGIFHWEEFEGRLLGVGDKDGVSNISLTTWPS